MDKEKAKKVSQLYQKTEKLESKLLKLNTGYGDEFQLYQSDTKVFDLEQEEVGALKKYFIDKLSEIDKELLKL